MQHKTVTGIVLSDKMDKTRIVGIETWKIHRLYKKRMRRTKKFFVHDEANESKIGDKVTIREIKPLSRNKSWGLVEIIERKIEV